jgi:c(7)-type cytochrome triheme protein
MRFAAVVAMLLAAIMFMGNAMAVPSGQKKEFAGGPMGKVVFDGKAHADKKLMCPACHVNPKLWEQKPGANPKMTMAAMNEGKFCGSCHDGKKAFSVKAPADCGKCHKK